MDNRLVLNLCGLIACGLYILSLVLHVEVVGDFGISVEGGSVAELQFLRDSGGAFVGATL
jgi:hypothetical protein